MALVDLKSEIKVTQLIAPQTASFTQTGSEIDGGLFGVEDDPEGEIVDGGSFTVPDDPEADVVNDELFGKAGTITGTAVGLTDYNSLSIAFVFGQVKDIALALKLQKSDDGSTDWTDIDSNQLNGSVDVSGDNQSVVLGVTEVEALTKAYVRPVVTFTEDFGTEVCATAIQGNAKSGPVGLTSMYVP